MKEEILTAKKWLEKEELFGCIDLWKDKVYEAAETYDFYLAMEKYANYKNKMLEYKIKEFRAILMKKVVEKAVEGYNFAKERNLCSKSDTIYQSYINIAAEDLMIKEYDKHFNIQNNIKE